MQYKVEFANPSYRRFFAAYRDEIMAAIEKCAANGDFMLREDTRIFERDFGKYIGSKYCVTTNSCSDALFLSLKALGVGPGDEVITVAHTFIATIQAIVHTGAKPVLVDVGIDELMDMKQVSRAVNLKTKAIIPVHFHGKVCDMEQLRGISMQNYLEDQDIYIVEDAAQAIGSTFMGKKAGSWGDTGCFSFGFPKMFGCYGDGGAVVTDNEEIYKKLLLLRNHWNIQHAGIDQKDYPQPEMMDWGWKSRLDNIQAAVLNVKFKYLQDIIDRRNELAARYSMELSGLPLQVPIHYDGEVVQEYVIRVDDNEEFKDFMDGEGIEVLVRDTIPNHKLKGLKLSHFNLPITDKIASQAVRLPVYPEMSDNEQEQVIRAIKKYYAEK